MLRLLESLCCSKEFWRRSSSLDDDWSPYEDLLHNLRSWKFYRFRTKEVLELRWCRNGLRFWGRCWLIESSCKRFVKRSWDFPQSLMSSVICFRMKWFRSILMDLSIFSLVPLPVEPVAPKRTLIGVSKVVSMTVWALEQVGARFLFFSF